MNSIKRGEIYMAYETIQPYVGHSNKEMTEYYNHYKEEMDVGMLRKVDFGIV